MLGNKSSVILPGMSRKPVSLFSKLKTFATLSTGEAIANPRFFRKDLRINRMTHNHCLDRDHTASRNILGLGLQSPGLSVEALGFIRGE